MSREEDCVLAKRITKALLDQGLVPSGDYDLVYDVVNDILNTCQYCQVSLVPQNDPIFCDHSVCQRKAANEEPPEDEDEDET